MIQKPSDCGDGRHSDEDETHGYNVRRLFMYDYPQWITVCFVCIFPEHWIYWSYFCR